MWYKCCYNNVLIEIRHIWDLLRCKNSNHGSKLTNCDIIYQKNFKYVVFTTYERLDKVSSKNDVRNQDCDCLNFKRYNFVFSEGIHIKLIYHTVTNALVPYFTPWL